MQATPKSPRQSLIEPLETRRLLATFTVTTSADAGAGSLRAAVASANATTAADTINFASSVSAVNLTGDQLTVTNPLTINDNSGGVTVDAGNNSRHFTVMAGTNLTLNGLELTNGNVPVNVANPTMPTRDNGGSIIVEAAASLTADGTAFTGNDAGDGGAIFSSGIVTLTDVTATGNVSFDPDSASSGGFLFAGTGTTTTVSGGLYDGNNAQNTAVAFGGGGAFRIIGGTFSMDGATVTNNTATLGGGIVVQGGSATIEDSDVSDNTAPINPVGPPTTLLDGVGGGMYLSVRDATVNTVANGVVTIRNTTVDGNTAEGETADGGGIYFVGPVNADEAGPAAPGVKGQAAADLRAFAGADSAERAFIDPTLAMESVDTGLPAAGLPEDFAGATFVMEDSEVTNNTATNIGGGVVTFEGVANYNRVSILGNEVVGVVDNGGTGGGIFAGSTSTSILNSTIANNSAVNGNADPDNPVAGDAGFGGGLSIQAGNPDVVTRVQLVQATITGNTADAAGGLIAASFTGATPLDRGEIDMTVVNSTIVDNNEIGVFLQAASTGLVTTARFFNTILTDNEAFADFDDDPATPDTEGPFNIATATGNGLGDVNATFGTGNSVLGSDILFDLDDDPATPATPGPLSTDDPMLGDLADNGGPTLTRLPSAGSLAIDNGADGLAVDPGDDNVIDDGPLPGDDVPLAFDQRRAPFARIVGGAVDVGAVELQQSVGPVLVNAAFATQTQQQVVVEFTGVDPASIQAGDLTLMNLTTGNTVTAANVSVTGQTATFTFTGLLPDGNYVGTIDAGDVTGPGGGTLDSDVTISFFVLTGDVNRNRVINTQDLLTVLQNFGNSGATLATGDVNLNGVVNTQDLLIILQKFGQSLPAPSSMLLAGGDDDDGIFSNTRFGGAY